MRYVAIIGANVTLAESQPEYDTIRVRAGTTVITDGKGGQHEVPCMTLELKPEQADLNRLLDGGSLYLTILGNAWPPCSVTTTDPASVPKPQGNA